MSGASARWRHADAVAAALLLSSAAAGAAPVNVGRASTMVPDEQHWEVTPVSSQDTRIDQGSSGFYPTERVLLRLPSAQGGTDAVVMLRGLKNGIPNGTLTMWGNTCEGVKMHPGVYVRSRSTKYDDDCLVVGGPYDMAMLLARLEPEYAKGLEARGLVPTGEAYLIRTNYAAAASQLGGFAVVKTGFVGLTEGAAPDGGSSGFAPEILRWAEQFAKEIRSSALSWSGKFNLPRIEVKEEDDE